MSEYDAELHNWRRESFGEHFVYVGTIFNDKKGRFDDGLIVRTSYEVKTDGDILQTRNTRYKLADILACHKVTILWGEDPVSGDKAETYAFRTEAELSGFLLGVSEAGGWLNYSFEKEGFVVLAGADELQAFREDRERAQ